MAVETARMKLKLFAVLGILSVVTCLRAQQTYSASNPGSQMATPMTGYANRLGIGVQLGEPFGFNAKYFLNDFMAVDGAVGWSPADYASAEIHADLLVHDFNMITVSNGEMPVYAGVGILGRFRNQGRANLGGFRFPVGVSYMPDSCPVDVFAEVGPEIIFSPFARGGITGAVGVRFWF